MVERQPAAAFACGAIAGVAVGAAAACVALGRAKNEGSSHLASAASMEKSNSQPPVSNSSSSSSAAAAAAIPDPPSSGSSASAAAASPAPEVASADKPDDAPEDCPGVSSDSAGKSSSCAGCPNQKLCASGEAKKVDPAVADVKSKLSEVKRKILVLSGKGGVGKSTTSAQLAFGFAARDKDVGLLDVDICGPSIPRMLGLQGQDVHQSSEGWSPVYAPGEERLAVMSIGFMLPNQDDAIIWRGPRKNGLIKQFLTDVSWGALDCLLIDTPPGTSDEHLSLVTYLAEASMDGAVIVTTPQEVSLMDVRKEINFCKKVNLPVIGVIENMSGYVCPKCGHEEHVFSPSTGGAKAMCAQMDVPYLGRIPLDGSVAKAGDEGKPLTHADGPVAKCIDSVIDAILEQTDKAK